MTTDAPLRAAIIGTGAIAHAHAEAITAHAGRIALIAVVDLDPDRATAFAEQHGAAEVHADADALFAAGDYDIVHICTPPQTHGPLAAQAMRAGAIPLVEKPTVLTLAELDALAEVSAETGIPVLTVFQQRFGAAALHLAELVRTGALGRPLVATCETLWFRADSYFDAPWRGKWAVEGGGPTMGHGIHQFDLLLATLGPWKKLSAFAARQSRPTDTEDVSMALVEFDNGALATVVNSIVSPRETSRLRFDFEHATVELEHLYGYDDTNWRFTAAPGHEHLEAVWNDRTGDEESGHRSQLDLILRALAAGEEPPGALEATRRTLEFAAATYASAFSGAPVTAGEVVAGHPHHVAMDGSGRAPWPPHARSAS